MGELRSAVDIEASADKVWREFTDFASFPSWNPLIRHASGRLVPGTRLLIKLALGRRLVTLRPTVTVVEPERELRWQLRQRIPGLFEVERVFRFEPRGQSQARFVQSETGTGLLAPLLVPLLRRTVLRGYRALDQALKARAEADHDAVTVERGVDAGPVRGIGRTGLPNARINPHVRTSAVARALDPKRGSAPWLESITSHETFTHDSLDSLGYDWGRVGDPFAKPKFPLKVYLPQTTEDLVKVVNEARSLGERLVIRSKGHSSNDLVLADHGTVLVTEKLNRILEIDEDEMTATVQAGMVAAELDDHLATMGLGLPIIGDHNHITVGGFASVGGISPASHRFGLFVDTVERLEYVTWDGELITCSRTERPEHFLKVLTGLGRHGVIATLTVRIIQADKYRTVLENHETHYRDVDEFIEGSWSCIRDPGEALMERGVWVDFPLPAGRSFGLGQFSAYHATEQSPYNRLRDRIAYNYLHGIGYVAGRLPRRLDRALKYVGMTGVLFSPTYATMKNVEFFTDKILDSTVGDPTRMFIVVAPLERYRSLFRASYDLMLEFRRSRKCFTFVSVYVKSIRSPYLAQGTPNDQFCELMFYCGIDRQGMTDEVLEALVNRLDDLCIEQQGFRYMHSRTSKDPARRNRVDPNFFYSDAAGVAEYSSEGASYET